MDVLWGLALLGFAEGRPCGLEGKWLGLRARPVRASGVAGFGILAVGLACGWRPHPAQPLVCVIVLCASLRVVKVQRTRP